MRFSEVTDHWAAQIREGTTESGVGVMRRGGIPGQARSFGEKTGRIQRVKGRCLKQEGGCRVWGSQMGQQRRDPRQEDKVVPSLGGETAGQEGDPRALPDCYTHSCSKHFPPHIATNPGVGGSGGTPHRW